MAHGPGKRRVLVVSNETQRTGAPLSLLEIVRYCRAAYDWDMRLVAGGRGELGEDFQRLLPCDHLDAYPSSPVIARRLPPVGLSYFARRLSWRLREERPGEFVRNLGTTLRHAVHDLPRQREDRKNLLRQQALARELADWKPDLVYLNTLLALRLARALDLFRFPTLLHVHEYRLAFASLLSEGEQAELLGHPVHFLAVSEAVKANLCDSFDIPGERVTLAPAGIDPAELARRAAERPRADILAELNLPQDCRLVGGSGYLSFLKAPELFVEVARQLCADPGLSRPVAFVWVGGREPELSYLRGWAQMLGLGGRVHFVGERENPFPYFAQFDVFALTSRNDSMPRVVLEAGALGVPVVHFTGSGGAAEVVGEDGGLAAGNFDTADFARCVAALLADETARHRMGAAIRQRVVRDFGYEERVQNIGWQLERLLREKAGG